MRWLEYLPPVSNWYHHLSKQSELPLWPWCNLSLSLLVFLPQWTHPSDCDRDEPGHHPDATNQGQIQQPRNTQCKFGETQNSNTSCTLICSVCMYAWRRNKKTGSITSMLTLAWCTSATFAISEWPTWLFSSVSQRTSALVKCQSNFPTFWNHGWKPRCQFHSNRSGGRRGLFCFWLRKMKKKSRGV